jgi:DNA-binding NarL/FixJ family response regulator
MSRGLPGAKVVPISNNPWGLTPAQARVMTAICETGCQKLAADALGLSASTVEYHVAIAARAMGERTRLGKYLAWDRWLRSGSRAPARHLERPAAIARAERP